MSDTLDLFAARASRDRALRIVEENAPDWTDRAVEAIRALAGKQATLTATDVWAMLAQEPREPRAMGAAICRAKAQGIIEPSGLPPMATDRANARKMAVWRSRLYRPDTGWEAMGRERKAGRILRAFLKAAGDRPRAEIASAAHRLDLRWWRAFALNVAGENHEPSDATILRVLEMLDAEAPADAAEGTSDVFHAPTLKPPAA